MTAYVVGGFTRCGWKASGIILWDEDTGRTGALRLSRGNSCRGGKVSGVRPRQVGGAGSMMDGLRVCDGGSGVYFHGLASGFVASSIGGGELADEVIAMRNTSGALRGP
jgi:hypothetical protein